MADDAPAAGGRRQANHSGIRASDIENNRRRLEHFLLPDKQSLEE